jgi:hypothetical protein
MSYPKSIKNNQCISSCFPPRTDTVHPITLENITNTKFPFCAVTPHEKNGEKVVIEECNVKDIEENNNDNLNILYPIISFNYKDFLKTYYQINSINDFYFWLKNNKSTPIFTKLRLFDCIINVFGKDIVLVEPIFVETIIDIIKKFWIKLMYRKLCHYIGIDSKNNIIIVKSKDNKLKKSEHIEQRTKFLISNIMTTSTITNIINNYFNEITNNKNIGIDDFLNFIILSLENKLNEL